MGKKITWFESYVTICKYSAEITDEQAKLFEEDEDKFLMRLILEEIENWSGIKLRMKMNMILVLRRINYDTQRILYLVRRLFSKET
jgi:hypothetical protein